MNKELTSSWDELDGEAESGLRSLGDEMPSKLRKIIDQSKGKIDCSGLAGSVSHVT